MAAFLALGGAVCWGVGDFFAGIASRRMAVITVLAISQAIGLAGVLIWVLVAGEAVPSFSEILPAVGAGVAGVVGLAALYRGLAIGAMGIVAPISAASPVVGLTADAAHGTYPVALQWLGIGLVLLGIATLSLEPAGDGGGRVAAGVGLALFAALGFGLFVVGLDAGSDESAAWAVVVARATSVSIAVAAALLMSKSLRPARGMWPLLVAVGVADTIANVLVAVASTYGSIGIVAVLSALYPVVTVVLARLFLDERLTTAKRIGGGVAISGAALVAAG